WLVSFFPGLRYTPSQAQPSFFSILIFSGLIATGFTLYFAYRRAQEESLALRAVAAEARYHTLENQMRPHFLFNALNSLAELIESRQEHAAETAYKLSELYRQILANSGLKTASLSSELEIVRAYLELEQLRFGARLQFSMQAPAESDQIYLPSLMLQTLVENAVKHGIAPSVTGGKVEIQIVNTQSASPSASQPGSQSVPQLASQPGSQSVPQLAPQLASQPGSQSVSQPASQSVSQSAPTPRLFFLRVTNTGSRYQTQVANQGVGLANTRARLELLYPGRHQFTIGSDDEGRTVAGFYFTGERID
ncbi:MAG: histidine kinase, partial [Acidobacteria bacterium]|nr:histidine kinase [Acidobacteriota bacterium]